MGPCVGGGSKRDSRRSSRTRIPYALRSNTIISDQVFAICDRILLTLSQRRRRKANTQIYLDTPRELQFATPPAASPSTTPPLTPPPPPQTTPLVLPRRPLPRRGLQLNTLCRRPTLRGVPPCPAVPCNKCTIPLLQLNAIRGEAATCRRPINRSNNAKTPKRLGRSGLRNRNRSAAVRSSSKKTNGAVQPQKRTPKCGGVTVSMRRKKALKTVNRKTIVRRRVRQRVQTRVSNAIHTAQHWYNMRNRCLRCHGVMQRNFRVVKCATSTMEMEVLPSTSRGIRIGNNGCNHHSSNCCQGMIMEYDSDSSNHFSGNCCQGMIMEYDSDSS